MLILTFMKMSVCALVFYNPVIGNERVLDTARQSPLYSELLDQCLTHNR